MNNQIIFFGNGPLADAVLSVLSQHFDIIFHARTKADLETVKQIKAAHPQAHGILASFGVLIKSDVLDIFEPEGILNVHPSLLPKFRGASPIESAILAGDTEFSVSIMKLVKKMDAGPIYFQTTLPDLPPNKSAIYTALATAGAEWLVSNLNQLPIPTTQDDSLATLCGKFDKSLSLLHPESHTATEILRQIVAFQGFPKSKYAFFGQECIILEAHLLEQDATAPLEIRCSDGLSVAVDRLQPANRKPMDAKSFLNGYNK